MLIKTTTIVTGLATLLTVTAPAIAGEADFPGSEWDKSQSADARRAEMINRQSADFPGSEWDDGARKVPGDSWDQGSRDDPNRGFEDSRNGQGDAFRGSEWRASHARPHIALDSGPARPERGPCVLDTGRRAPGSWPPPIAR